jgi:PleD family two-component response regulator
MAEKKRIFIADDDVEALTSLKKLLILSGFDADGTSKPKEIVGMIKTFKPDIVLLDLLMPEVGGFEICEILNDDRETQGIPIFVVSSLGGYTDIKKAYKLGVVGYFTKPYDYIRLIQEINRVLESKDKK